MSGGDEMLDRVRVVLSEVTAAHADTRTHFCRVEAAALQGAACSLSGAVLDESTLSGLVRAIEGRVPGCAPDGSRVRVLRRPGTAVAAVGTTVTGLYAQSSFLSEQLSQLANGQRVEILIEEGRWGFVRQADGYLGWAYTPYLVIPSACTATHLVCEPVCLLRAEPAARAPLVSRAVAGTAVAADTLEEGWAHLALEGGVSGWVRAEELRSFARLPHDEAGRRTQLVDDAAGFIGVPYLWGGCTALGIDCSGFVQLLHRLAGMSLPRDADMQFEAGHPVEAPFRPGDLLFFAGGDDRRITHVAMSLGGWRIIHSSRSRNGVYVDDVKSVDHLRDSYVGARSFVAPALGAGDQ